MNFVVEVITIGGGLPEFLGVSFSSRVFYAPLVSVYMSVVLRCSENLRVITVLVGSRPASDFVANIIDILAVCEESLEISLLRLVSSWKSSWTAYSNQDFVSAPHCPGCVFTFRTAFNSFNVRASMP
jgi:hypothetical protein